MRKSALFLVMGSHTLPVRGIVGRHHGLSEIVLFASIPCVAASRNVSKSQKQASNAQGFLSELEKKKIHTKSKHLTNMGPITIYLDHRM